MRSAGAPAIQVLGRHNPLVKRIRVMLRAGELRDADEVLLETPNLIEDAIASGVEITSALLRSTAGNAARTVAKKLPHGTPLQELEPESFDRLVSTQHNPGILAMAKAPSWQEEDVLGGAQPLVIVLAGIQDPGNCGTILRAAEAFGATGVLATKGTVSPYNAKVIRAAAGSLFRLPMLTQLSASQIVNLLRREKIALFSTVVRDGKPFAEIDIARPLAIALGSEGSGLPRELEQAGERVSLAMARQVESLNVAAAASVILHEIARRRLDSSGYTRAVERRP